MSGSPWDSDGQRSLRPIDEFGFVPCLDPLGLSLAAEEALDELEAVLSHWPAVAIPFELLDPVTLVATQFYVDAQIIEGMIEAEDLPPILVIRQGQNLFVHDGHHRTVRALLDNKLVSAVVFST